MSTTQPSRPRLRVTLSPADFEGDEIRTDLRVSGEPPAWNFAQGAYLDEQGNKVMMRQAGRDPNATILVVEYVKLTNQSPISGAHVNPRVTIR